MILIDLITELLLTIGIVFLIGVLIVLIGLVSFAAVLLTKAIKAVIVADSKNATKGTAYKWGNPVEGSVITVEGSCNEVERPCTDAENSCSGPCNDCENPCDEPIHYVERQ